MTFRAGIFSAAFCGLMCLVLSGCFPAGSGPLDEEKEPHFLAGKSRISTLDYKGAIECFEKALQVNPQSASAHFELAWLFDQKEIDPAAAIYHYDHYLKLRANPGNTDIVKQRIGACKQVLAEGASFSTEKMQRQFEQVSEENKRLTQENKQLHEELANWSSYAARLQTLTNETVAATHSLPARTPALAMAQLSTARTTASPDSSAISSRTHTVRPGDTPTLIAKKYGVKLSALMSANPNLDPRRLRVGQVLRIPGA